MGKGKDRQIKAVPEVISERMKVLINSYIRVLESIGVGQSRVFERRGNRSGRIMELTSSEEQCVRI